MIDLETTKKTHLRVDEVAELTGKCLKTIYNWMNRGRLEYVRVGPSGTKIPIEAVRRLFTTKTRPERHDPPSSLQSV